jgi:hypothetical protein
MLDFGGAVIIPETNCSVDDEITQGQKEGYVPE